MQRVRNIDYDEDEVYSGDEDYGEDEGGYTQEDRDNLANLVPVVRAELDEAGMPSTTQQIEEGLYFYFWDVGKTVTYLKNKNTPKQPQQQQPKKEKAKSKFDEAQQKSAEKADQIKANRTTISLEKKTEELNLNSAASAPPQPKVRSKGLDVPKLWSEEKSKRKSSAAFVVIGHVDHGKSTLMGRLLLDTGAVSQRDIDKYKKQATELGKASFALAWVMDTSSEERERGVTVDIAQHHFSTETTDFTILDAPGHRDFIPNMIGGASMADLGVLVVDANQLDSGLKGQTREHILLAQAVGLQKIVVAVNKLDSTVPAWNRDAFKSVSAILLKLLAQTDFKQENVAIIPCSGLSGENVVKAPASSTAAAAWVSKDYTTLLQQLEKSAPHTLSAETVQKPLRMQIADVFRGGITNPVSISGRIGSGSLQVGDSLVVQPSAEVATVKGVEVSGKERGWAIATDIPTLHLVGVDPQHIRAGDFVCSSHTPVANVVGVTVKVQAIDSLLPQRTDVHIGRLHVPATISQLVVTMDAKGETLKKKPRMVKAGQRAMIKLTLDDAFPLEAGDRIVLRKDGSTIAAGTVRDTKRSVER